MSKLFYTNILIWIVWPIVFITGLIIIPKLIILLLSIFGLIFLSLIYALIYEDNKSYQKEGLKHHEQH